MTEFKVVRGNPTPAELAAALAVLVARSNVKVLPEPSKLTKWGDPAAHARQGLAVGNRAWRQSAWAKH